MIFQKKIAPIFLLVILLMLCIKATMKIDAMPISGDGFDNIKLSYHLAFHNVISMGYKDENGQLMPSNLREPLPILLSAVWIKSIPILANSNSFDDLIHGKKLILLKVQNVIYVALTIIGTFLFAYEILKSYTNSKVSLFVSAIAALISFYCIHIIYVTTLLTEFQAAFLIVWFSWSWLKAWHSRSNYWYVTSGILLGCLILTKAAFLYISIVSITFIFLFIALFVNDKKSSLKQLLILVLALVTIAPWYIRNYISIGVWELAQRGPVVLMTRAYKSNLTADEFKGAFYAYAPLSLKKVMRNITGFSAIDRFDGGRLQRLSRFPAGDSVKRDLGDEDGAISYYMKATTHFNNIHKKYSQKIKDPIKARIAADHVAQNEAIEMIKTNMIGHLKSTLVFAWRGAWPCNTVDGRWSAGAKLTRQPIWQEILPFLGLISIFAFFINGVFKKNAPVVITTLFGVSTFIFYSLATHFIPRYSEMFIAVWVVCFVVFCVMLTQKLTYKNVN